MSHHYPWSSAYAAAVLETNPEKVTALIAAAENAIAQRVDNLTVGEGERHALEAASAGLLLLRKDSTTWPSQA